jgi:hypothetical protein
VATIDTMLSFYLAFIYTDKPYFDKDRILCMAQFMFDVEQKNRLEQKGLLKRFSITCYGKQITLETMRAEKADKFKELAVKGKRNTNEWNEWFFKYAPGANLSNDVLSKGATKLSRESKQDNVDHESKDKKENKGTKESKKSLVHKITDSMKLYEKSSDTSSIPIYNEKASPIYNAKKTVRFRKKRKPRRNTLKQFLGFK